MYRLHIVLAVSLGIGMPGENVRHQCPAAISRDYPFSLRNSQTDGRVSSYVRPI